MSVYDECMSVYDEWMSVYDEWMRVYDEWMSVYDEWMSVYDGWMQWVFFCNDMNGDCAWRMLGECKCERLPKKSQKRHGTSQIIMCDNIQLLFTSSWK